MELYWLPVGAGKLSPPRKWSLWLWEAADAALHRRPRKQLLHAGLKIRTPDAVTRTIELMPDFLPGSEAPAITGPVGVRWAGRWKYFRYRLACEAVERLPDEEFAVEPATLLGDGEVARRLLGLAAETPAFTWGRRAAGTHEMWTSDSAISWLLLRAGIALDGVAPPAYGRAPGWSAGVELAEVASRRGTPVTV